MTEFPRAALFPASDRQSGLLRLELVPESFSDRILSARAREALRHQSILERLVQRTL